jgi:putative membrane protein
MMYGGWMGGFGWIGMLVGLVFWVLVLGGLAWLVTWAVRRAGSGGSASTGSSAVEIAQQRYARGEITREQYQQILADLKN